MGHLDELRTVFKEILDEREPVRPITHGLLGDGLGNLWVPGDSDNRVWFRKNGQTSQLSKVHCWRVRPIYELPVICGYTTEEPTFYQVLTCDRDKLELAWQGMSTVPRHAETHIWADTLGGDDPVMIWTRALMPFRVSPQATPDLTVQIQGPEVYLWLTGWQEWLGDAIVDLTASVPGAGLGLHRYTLIYIDGATSTAMTLDGAAVGAAVPLPPGSWPSPPSGSIPVGLVHLSSDQTTITEDDIVDGRVIVGSAGGSITPAAHHLIDTTVHDDTEAYAAPTRGEIVRFNTDWERYDASTLGAVLIGDGTDVISDTTPTFVGVVTFNAGVTMGGASGVNELTIPGNQAIAFEILDTNAVEYLRIDTAPQLAIIWNFGEADVDFNIRAGAGISDPTDAFFVEGSTGFVYMGDIAPTYIGHLTLADLAVSTTASYRGAALHHVKTAGVTDHLDTMYGLDCIMQLNQVGGVVGFLYGLRFEAEITAGDVGTVANNRDIGGIWGSTDLRGGTVHGDARGIGGYVGQQAANTVTGDLFAGHLEISLGGTVTGTTYMHFLQEDGNADFGYYQTTSAGVAGANYLEGKLTLASAELEFTAATGLNLIEIPTAQAIGFLLSDTAPVEYLRIDTAPQLEVIWNNGEADIDYRIAASGIAQALFVQGSSGDVWVKHAPPTRALFAAVSDTAITVAAYYQYIDAAGGAATTYGKARGTYAVPVIVNNGDVIGGFTGAGYDGAAFQTAVSIRFYVDGAPAAGDMPGKILFQTTPDGTVVLADRMVLREDGSLVIGTPLAAAPTGLVHIEDDTTPQLAVTAVAGSSQIHLMDSTANGLLLSYRSAADYLAVETITPTVIMMWDRDTTDVGIGSTASPTANSGKVLFFGDNVNDPTMGANTCGFYGKDVAGTVEAFAIDEAGNQQQLTAHNFTLFDPDPSYGYPFSYYAKNRFVGEINVDMYGAIQEVERLSGKQFIYELLLAEIPSWAAWQLEEKERVEERQVLNALDTKIEVPKADVLEYVPEIREEQTSKMVKTGRYRLKGDMVVEEETPEVRNIPTGRMVWKLKKGAQFDSKTGKFYRYPLADEVVVKPYVPKNPPQWMADRIEATAQLPPPEES